MRASSPSPYRTERYTARPRPPVPHPAAPHPEGVATRAVGPELLVHQVALQHLVGRRRRQLTRHAHIAGPPFGTQVWLGVDPAGEALGIEGRAVALDEGGHHLVPRLVVGDAIDGSHDDVGMARDGRLDRSGGEVLAVD